MLKLLIINGGQFYKKIIFFDYFIKIANFARIKIQKQKMVKNSVANFELQKACWMDGWESWFKDC